MIAVYRLNPRPSEARVNHFRTPGGGVVTAITRRWKPGDAEWCRRCSTCTAYDDLCVIQVGQLVRLDDAADFSAVGLKVQAPV